MPSLSVCRRAVHEPSTTTTSGSWGNQVRLQMPYLLLISRLPSMSRLWLLGRHRQLAICKHTSPRSIQLRYFSCWINDSWSRHNVSPPFTSCHLHSYSSLLYGMPGSCSQPRTPPQLSSLELDDVPVRRRVKYKVASLVHQLLSGQAPVCNYV